MLYVSEVCILFVIVFGVVYFGDFVVKIIEFMHACVPDQVFDFFFVLLYVLLQGKGL